MQKRKRFKFFALTAFFIIAIVCIFFVSVSVNNANNYNEALKQMQNNQYESAMKIFLKLDEYKDAPALSMECRYLLAIQLSEDEKTLEDAETNFSLLKDYKESSTRLNKCKNDIAKKYYRNGDFEKAKQYYQDLNEVENSNDLQFIESISPFQGEWYANYFDFGLVIKGWNVDCYSLTGDLSGKSFEKKWTSVFLETDLENGILKIYVPTAQEYMTLQIDGDKILMHFEGSDFKLKSMSFINYQIMAPSIGMTPEQVKSSTWGKPRKVNKTTTASGVSEQWCYSDNRYIYFDDGIVTTIQE